MLWVAIFIYLMGLVSHFMLVMELGDEPDKALIVLWPLTMFVTLVLIGKDYLLDLLDKLKEPY